MLRPSMAHWRQITRERALTALREKRLCRSQMAKGRHPLLNPPSHNQSSGGGGGGGGSPIEGGDDLELQRPCDSHVAWHGSRKMNELFFNAIRCQ